MTFSPEQFSSIVRALLQAGVAPETLQLLLALPVVVMVISAIRLLVGFKAFGVSMSLLIALVFAATGFLPGLVLYLVTLLVGLSMRALFRSLRLLHLPRMAMTMTALVIVLLGVVLIGAQIGLPPFLNAPLWAIVILLAFVESFVTAQIESGTGSAVYLSFETCVIGALGMLLFNSDGLATFLFTYPWVILLTFPVNLLMGRWTGLRLVEYIRFHALFSKMDEK